jgi:hypothetical protein
MGFKASQRRSVPLDAPASQPSSGVVHSMSGFFSQTPYEPWCYTYCMPLSQFRSYTVISIASHEHTVWCGYCQEVKKGINSFSGIGVQKRIARACQRTLPCWQLRLWASAGDGRASWRGRAQPCTAGCALRGVSRGSRISQGYVPRLACSACWYTSPWPAFRRYGGAPRPGASTTTGRCAAGDEKRLALPRRLAYYRLNKERDQRASAAGADDRSSPAAWGLRLVGTC